MTSFQTSPCLLCPRQCGVKREQGHLGYCSAPHDIVVARAALHYWEEPPISGETGSGTVFFTHCPLKCVYCQNAALAQGEAGRVVSVEELADLFLNLEEQGALNINCVTPTHYSDQIAQAVEGARSKGLKLPILWNTSGYETQQTISALAGTVNAYLTDFKYASSELAARYSHAPDYPQVALKALACMVNTAGLPTYDEYHGQERLVSGVVVRHLLLPEALEESKTALRMLFATFGNDVRYSLMNQYTPVICGSRAHEFPELTQRTSFADYEALLDFADTLGIEDYFWQEGNACEESFIPEWDF